MIQKHKLLVLIVHTICNTQYQSNHTQLQRNVLTLLTLPFWLILLVGRMIHYSMQIRLLFHKICAQNKAMNVLVQPFNNFEQKNLILNIVFIVSKSVIIKFTHHIWYTKVVFRTVYKTIYCSFFFTTVLILLPNLPNL